MIERNILLPFISLGRICGVQLKQLLDLQMPLRVTVEGGW